MILQTGVLFLAATFAAASSGWSATPTPSPTSIPTATPITAEQLRKDAEHWLYAYDVPDHLDRLDWVLKDYEKVAHQDPYLYWARARLAFWQKEQYYLKETPETREKYNFEKLALGEECHKNADQCLKLAPKSAECHLMKGVCYAMQASTWGKSLKSVQVVKSMDDEWKKAMELESDFMHQGEVTTRQLAMILRGIMHRLIPSSWWFRILAGVRGDKEKAYHWMKEGVTGFLLREPVTVLEYGATVACYGQRAKKPDVLREGMSILRKGLTLPTRYPPDDRDKQFMQWLADDPKNACNYRRERTEDLSEDKVKDALK